MTEETAKGLLDFLLPQLHQESATTRKVLAAVPADHLDYRPNERCMTGLALASHIALAEAFFLNGVLRGAFEWKSLEFASPAEVLAYYDETIPAMLAQIAELPPAKLSEPIKFATWNDPAVTYLNMSLKHGIHHRGQLTSYLRPMGGRVPSVYGPTADDELEAAASH